MGVLGAFDVRVRAMGLGLARGEVRADSTVGETGAVPGWPRSSLTGLADKRCKRGARYLLCEFLGVFFHGDGEGTIFLLGLKN